MAAIGRNNRSGYQVIHPMRPCDLLASIRKVDEAAEGVGHLGRNDGDVEAGRVGLWIGMGAGALEQGFGHMPPFFLKELGSLPCVSVVMSGRIMVAIIGIIVAVQFIPLCTIAIVRIIHVIHAADQCRLMYDIATGTTAT
jgi:hypothetical protein